VAILVGSRDQRTQFWKGAIQESFQQNLVDIGSVVSEEKIFFKSNLAGMVPGWVPFKIVSDSHALHSRWPLLLKIEILQLKFELILTYTKAAMDN
jgi:hypothetical protein